MTNPNPGNIPEPMWQLWLSCPVPGVKLSGIYADKKGYHNTVSANKRKWPDNYSIKLPLDLVPFNNQYARAIDLTMSNSEMVKWTTRMRDSAMDSHDSRLGAVKEFYGTLDNKTVFGLSKDSVGGTWRRVTSDKSHLWHGHTSIFTSFVNNWSALSPILSVWAGETTVEWSDDGVGLPQKDDTGQEVIYWQLLHNAVRSTVSPASPVLTVDGNYGPEMSAAIRDFWVKNGGDPKSNYAGQYITGTLAMKYQQALIKNTASPVSQVDPAQLEAIVNRWLEAKIPSELIINGKVTIGDAASQKS